MARESCRLGIDVGGTFTDLVLYRDDTQQIYIHKVPSIPKMPSHAVAKGVREIIDKAGVRPGSIEYFIHGTTIPTNAVIERKGAKTGLLVSVGCRDMLEIGRIRMPSAFDLMGEKTRPLVERACVRELQGKVTPSGQVKQDLSLEEVRSAVRELVQDDVRSCAVCLLNSYANSALEEETKRAITETFPGLYLSISSEVWPEIREYERAVVTVLDVYVKQLIDEYLATLSVEVEQLGLSTRVYVTKSNGGIMTAASARERPIETMLSGPAAGVMGAAFIAELSDVDRAITLDMGGTSADISIVKRGEPTYSTEGYVGDFPLVMPSVDVASIGSGGGSIAWVDAMGLLKVGPQSAGADPGPACYGQGGTEPTITDAYLVCGYLNPDNFLGGRVKLSSELAEEAVSTIADPLSISVSDAAEGIIRVATSVMLRELYSLMSKVGIDPREYSIIAFGGAGPIHAPLLAEEVGINRIVVPPHPGVLSALGTLITDVKRDAIRTVHKDLSEVSSEELLEYGHEMEESLLSWLRDEGPIVQGAKAMTSADMCYKGQGYELQVELPEDLLERGPDELARLFHQTHQRVYSHSDVEAPVELVNLRTRIVGKSPEVDLGIVVGGEKVRQVPPRGTRTIYYRGAQYSAEIWRPEDLGVGNTVVGPAIVEPEDTTILIPPGFAATADERGIIAAARKGARFQ